MIKCDRMRKVAALLLAAPGCAALSNFERTLSQIIESITNMFEGFSPF